MVKLGAMVLAVFFLTGCSGKSREIQRAMDLRAQLLRAELVSFDADITADYGDKRYSFTLACRLDSRGDLGFTVTQPETISGIAGHISGDGGKLTFDDVALQLDTMADGQLTPVSAPWTLMKTLRSGYLTAAGKEDGLLRLTIDDSYRDSALTADIWLTEENIPLRGDICYDGRRILSLTLRNFQIS